jgi:hypothetical protein
VKVIAQRGGPDYLLVQTRLYEGAPWGRVFNVRQREMGPERLVAAIAKFGYWTEYTGSQDVLDDLTGVRFIGGPRDNESQGAGDQGARPGRTARTGSA